MAWNGSGGSTTPQKKAKASGTSSSSLFHGIAALVLVLVIGGVAYLFVTQDMPKAKEPTEEKVEKKAIEVVEPEIAERVEVVQERPVISDSDLPYWRRSSTNGLTAAQIKKWKIMNRPPPAHTNMTAVTAPRPRYAVFGSHAENEIACLMTLEPGKGIVGSPHYGKRFEEEFMRSCEVPIIVEADDDDYTAQLKRDMIQMKIDLRQRMAEGESLSQIMTDTRNEYQRLAQVRRDIEKMAKDLIKESASSESDIDSVIEAANKMLEDKGIEPLNLNPLVKRALLRSIQTY